MSSQPSVAWAHLPDFVLVSSNPNKVAEAQRILGVPLETVAIDLPERQSNDLLEVLRSKGEEAWRRVQRPLVVEETGLELAALNGFPGPLVKWMLDAVGASAIAEVVQARGNDRVTARCAVLFVDGGSEPVVGEGATRGRLVLPARGTKGFGWDPVFQPEGHQRTYGELSQAIKDEIGHRGRAWRDLASKLGG